SAATLAGSSRAALRNPSSANAILPSAKWARASAMRNGTGSRLALRPLELDRISSLPWSPRQAVQAMTATVTSKNPPRGILSSPRSFQRRHDDPHHTDRCRQHEHADHYRKHAGNQRNGEQNRQPVRFLLGSEPPFFAHLRGVDAKGLGDR